MIVAHWLGICAGAILLFCLLLAKRRIWLSPLYWSVRYLFCYCLAYPLVLHRREHWSSITNLQMLVFFAYLTINAVYVGIPTPTAIQAAGRLGKIAALNMVPLFISHANPIINQILPVHVHHISHHWIGRICIAQAIAHSVLMMLPAIEWTQDTVSGLTTVVALTFTGIFSTCLVRWWNWEVFSSTHRLLTLAAAATLIWHLKSREVLYFSLIGPSFWLLLLLLRLFLKKKSHDVIITKYYRKKKVHDREIRDLDVIQLTMHLHTPITIGPGKHIYLRVHDGDLGEQLQKHPFMVTWWEAPLKTSDFDEENQTSLDICTADNLTVLVQPANGLTRRLANRSLLSSVSFDGPYGQELHLETFNNVFLVARGVGILGVLSYAKQLLAMKLKQDRHLITRKVDLYWEIDDESQEEWAAPFIRKLQVDDEVAHLLQIWCFWSQKPDNHSPKIAIFSPAFRYIYPKDEEKLSAVIKTVVGAAAGRNIIVACGVSPFTNMVRCLTRSVSCPANVVDFVEVEYRPRQRVEGFDKTVEHHQLPSGARVYRTRIPISRPIFS